MPLNDCRILVVEDEYMLACDLQQALEDAGAVVIGPDPRSLAPSPGSRVKPGSMPRCST